MSSEPQIPEPRSSDPRSPTPDPRSPIHVHAVLGEFTAQDLARADQLLDGFLSPRRLLVQWVPHGYGYRSMNLGFCEWVLRRAKHGDRCDVMVHEPFLDFWEGSLRQTAAALVHRVMTVTLLRAATRVFVSIPAWERKWRPYALGKAVPFEWLPVPNTLPQPKCDAVRFVRERQSESGRHLVGHLGTYGSAISQTLMESTQTLLALSPRTNVLLMGRGSLGFHAQFAAANPLLALRVRSTGYLPPAELAESVAACDLLLQPYPDGVSTRRTSAMAGLALGVPIATNRGHLTEPLWAESSCVALANGSDSLAMTASRLLEDRRELDRLAAAGKSIYDQRFDVTHTISALRRAH